MPLSPLNRPAIPRRHFFALLGAGAGLAAMRPGPAGAAPAVERSVKVGVGLYELAVNTASNLVHVAAVGARGQNAAKILGAIPGALTDATMMKGGTPATKGLKVGIAELGAAPADQPKFMIFVTDAAILYAYMIGGAPVWLADLMPAAMNVVKFVKWAGVSGFVVAFLLFGISAFSVPLLCERRIGLVGAVVTSVRVVFGNFTVAIFWAFFLSTATIASVLLLPLLPLTLPWLAYASRALYRQVLPTA